ncbi:MAG: DUF3179 domain-containing protein [Candidatus Vogelbacteria bacterium]|nr:DUF3179 domain-containing protein [Candidatus Vogelbacteria bacterium]
MIQGEPVLITYCPLCATGIVFERKVDGAGQEFGVSGKLWQSNLLMYNRASDEAAVRDYGRDPYGDYYTSEPVSFGASFRDTRLHPKALVVGIEIDGKHKAYPIEALKIGNTSDTFAGKNVLVSKDSAGRISITIASAGLPHITSFWFSWLAVHPDTELFQ